MCASTAIARPVHCLLWGVYNGRSRCSKGVGHTSVHSHALGVSRHPTQAGTCFIGLLGFMWGRSLFPFVVATIAVAVAVPGAFNGPGAISLVVPITLTALVLLLGASVFAFTMLHSTWGACIRRYSPSANTATM